MSDEKPDHELQLIMQSQCVMFKLECNVEDVDSRCGGKSVCYAREAILDVGIEAILVFDKNDKEFSGKNFFEPTNFPIAVDRVINDGSHEEPEFFIILKEGVE